jgi:23S rRNA pseudouridine1911/1915/1917 synthase
VSSQTAAFEQAEGAPQRLDKFLVEKLPELSRTRIQNLIKDGQVRVNGQAVRKAAQVIEAPSRVEVHIPEARPTDLQPEAIPLEIVFENEHLMVINKPSGMVVHPAAGHDTGTLVHAVLAHAPDIEGIGGELRPGIVHRLDKDTSGLIIIAKDDLTHRWLIEQFKDRKVNKTYLALVDGHPPTPSGRIEAPVGRSPAHRQRMAVVQPPHGRMAVTEYRTVESFPEHTLLEAHPITGRTHQIRVHMQFLGCPVAGDTVYGHRKPTLPIKRQFLHAFRLVIQLKGEKTQRTFEAPLPADLALILEQLKFQKT